MNTNTGMQTYKHLPLSKDPILEILQWLRILVSRSLITVCYVCDLESQAAGGCCDNKKQAPSSLLQPVTLEGLCFPI